MTLEPIASFGEVSGLPELVSMCLEGNALTLHLASNDGRKFMVSHKQVQAVYCVRLVACFEIRCALIDISNSLDKGCWAFEVHNSAIQAAFSADSAGLESDWNLRCYMIALDDDHVFLIADKPPTLVVEP